MSSNRRKSTILPDHHVYERLHLQSHPPDVEDHITVNQAKDLIENKEIAKFFKLCYNIHPPFKVLLGAYLFIYLQRNKLTTSAISNMFCGVEHKLYITRHTVEVLQTLAKNGGLNVSECITEANTCSIQRCANKLRCLNDSECIEAIVGSSNSLGFIGAVQEPNLERLLKQIDVPLVHVRNGSLELCLPSQEQIDSASYKRSNGPREEKKRKRNRASSERKLLKSQQMGKDLIASLRAAARAPELQDDEPLSEDDPEEGLLDASVRSRQTKSKSVIGNKQRNLKERRCQDDATADVVVIGKKKRKLKIQSHTAEQSKAPKFSNTGYMSEPEPEPAAATVKVDEDVDETGVYSKEVGDDTSRQGFQGQKRF